MLHQPQSLFKKYLGNACDTENLNNMNAEHRELLRQNTVAITENLQTELVLPHLLQRHVLSSYAIENIQECRTRLEKAMKLLDAVSRAGPLSFDAFHQSLVDTGQDFLARLLKPDVHLPSTQTCPEQLQDQTTASRQHHQDLEYPTQAGGLLDITVTPADTIRLGNDVYPMYRRERGLCLIINNKTFHKNTTFEDREGTDIDADNLMDLFIQLSFRVTHVKDKTAEEIKMEVSAFKRRQAVQFQATVVCILSHGGEDGNILGVDGATVRADDLANIFHDCTALRNKPKVFIIQACHKESSGKREVVDGELSGKVSRDVTDAQRCSDEMPDRADCLITYSSLPGSWSWSNESRGSWFIQALVLEFAQNAHKEEILHLFTNINKRIMKYAEGHELSGEQIPTLTNNLLKKFFFNPKRFSGD